MDPRPLQRDARLPEPGEIIDRYEVICEVGRGGMAVIYAARRRSMAGFTKLLALKLILPHLRGDRQFVNMFLDEARLASSCDHPNVVKIFDLGEHEGAPFLVMELLRGQPLIAVAERLGAEGARRDVGWHLCVMAHAAAGLHAAHEAVGADGIPLKIVHRDVSPQNIHVGYDGEVKVIDFGIAEGRGRLVRTSTGNLRGKFHYMAPEQIDGRDVDRRADVWSLAVTAWEVLAARPLFYGDSSAQTLWNVMNMPVPPLEEVAPDVPPAVARLINDCLQRDRARRPPSCEVVAQVLRSASLALGYDGATAVGRSMIELFGDQRARDERRLAEAIHARRTSQVAVTVPDTPHDTPRPRRWAASTASRLTRGRGRTVALGLATAAALALAWAALTPIITEAAPPAAGAAPTTTAAATTVAVPTVTVLTPIVPPSRRPITVHVDPRARQVLLNGRTTTERSITLELTPEESALLELAGPGDLRLRRVVTANDDGEHITFERAAAESSAAAKRASTSRTKRAPAPEPKPKPAGSAPTPLLANPYEASK